MSNEAKERWKSKNIRGYPRFSDLPYVADADGAVVCRMSGGNCETVEARAVLIAAAPETAAERDRLLEEKASLIEALVIIDDQMQSAIDGAPGPSLWLLAVKKITHTALVEKKVPFQDICEESKGETQ